MSLLTEYKAIMEAESQRQRDGYAHRMSSDVAPPEQRNPQYAVGVSSGANILGLSTNIQREVAPTHVSAAIDVKNAFNTIQRPLLFEALSKFRENFKCPKELRRYDAFQAYARLHYAHGPRQLSFFMADGERKSVMRSVGVNQGCPHGSALFSIALDFIVLDVFEKYGHLFPSVTSNWFADDGVASGPLLEVKEFISILSRELQSRAGLEVKFVTCLGGVETDEASLLEEVEGLKA